ncbi:MAG: complex I subunit 4 family protein, partial [Gammaproteobacteria bacterium]
VFDVPWIEAWGTRFTVGVDGLSVMMVLLTTLIMPLAILGGWTSVRTKVHAYHALMLILTTGMLGVFVAKDLFLFYVMWEVMLVPMYFIIGIWGGARRVYATIKFFLYTFLGSVFMLVALLYLYYKGGSFSILAMHGLPLDLSEQMLIFIAFLLAFAVKVPMWPVHTWLPDAHVEAPTGGSVILAAIMLKMGGYGFLRFSLPIVPDGSQALDGFMISLSLIAIVYIGFVALVQEDMKKLIAYSSISHMGFVTLGLFVVFRLIGNGATPGSAAMGIEGGMVQMISHGFVSGALFLCVGVLYERIHSRRIQDYGGVVNTMPVFAALMMVFCMANAGLPGTSWFVGEFLVILTSVK